MMLIRRAAEREREQLDGFDSLLNDPDASKDAIARVFLRPLEKSGIRN